MSLVVVDHITKEFTKGGHTIRPLDDASLTIDEGEFVSLMGASGSGKSTLLNLIAGIDRPTTGTDHRGWASTSPGSRGRGSLAGGPRTSATSFRRTI